jgi:nucleotide-binding universal stress UspA family protein
MITQNLIENRFVRCAFAAPDRIVVATDLTDFDYLIPHAIAQAKASQAALTFIHVIEPDESLPAEAGANSYIDPIKIARDARLVMEGVSRQVRAEGIECTTAVRHGFAMDVIAEMIHQTGAGRLIAGTHSRHGIKRMVVGSVAKQLLNHFHIPVCIIGPNAHRSTPQTTLKTVLHPVSLSGTYEQSAALALNLAQYCKAQLTLLHVFNPDREAEIAPGRTITRPYSALDRLVPDDDLFPSVLTKETVGRVVPEILRVADEIHADLIVLGVHADSLFGTPQGGRTAYEIIASAACPVLTLKLDPGSLQENVSAFSLQIDRGQRADAQ